MVVVEAAKRNQNEASNMIHFCLSKKQKFMINAFLYGCFPMVIFPVPPPFSGIVESVAAAARVVAEASI